MSMTPILPWRPYALVFALLLAACSRVAAACPQGAEATAKEFVGLFTSSTLSAESAGRLLGSQHTARREGGYWLLQSKTCPLSIVFPARAEGAPLPEAELRLRLKAGLQLQHLEADFGAGEPLLSGKTSSVMFRLPGAPGGSVLAFARLYSDRVQPASPVLTLLLRRAVATP